MSDFTKGQGAKIGIEFTEELKGNIEGNESAFTIKGKEYKYVDGELIDGDYKVESVERYPIQRVWELEQAIELENVGEIKETVGWNTNDFGIGNPATGTRGYKFIPNNNCLIIKFRIFATETTSTVHLWDVDSKDILATKIFATNIGEWNEISLDMPIQIYNDREYLISANYTSGNNYYRNDSPKQSEFNELVYLGNFTSTSHNTYPNTSSQWGNAVDIVMQIGSIEYITPKYYLKEIDLQGEYRIQWQGEIPQDTNIIIEISTGQAQGNFVEISNGDVIDIDTNLWIKATLSTEDVSKTPILKELWLEEPEAPKDSLLLTMNPYKRFHNVEGILTVKYDMTKGNLQGQGGYVESFEVDFTPEDLVPLPNPIISDKFVISAEAEVVFFKITYHHRFANEKFIITPIVNIDFIHIDEINP